MNPEFVTVNTPDHGTLEFELAGLGSRFCAHVLDGLLIGLILVLVFIGLLVVGLLDLQPTHPLTDFSWANSWLVAVLLVVVFLVLWGYFVFFECLMRGRTPGKRELGIRVIREDGLPIGFRESALRNLVRAADALPPPSYLVGGLVMLLDQHGRRLGDLLAGTLVVRETFARTSETKATAAWAARVEHGQSRQAVVLPGGQLTVTQVDLVEQFLARRHQLSPERREALAWQITAPLLGLCSEDPATWETRSDRTEACEGFLHGLVQTAKAPRAPASLMPTPPASAKLF